jgi:hypothetical protein
MTCLLTFWWIIAALNVPAWWLGIGICSGWTNTLIANTHLAFTVILVGLSWILPFDSLTVVLFWIIGGLGMQVFLYILMELKTKMVRRMYFSIDMAIQLIVFMIVVGLTVLVKFMLLSFSFPPNVIVLSTIFFFYLPILILTLANKFHLRFAH